MKKYVVTIASALMFTFFCLFLGTTGSAEALTKNQQQMIDQKADAIIATATGLIGKAVYGYYNVNVTPMQMGCGGFVKYVFLQNGIDLGTLDNNVQSTLGEYVPKSELKKGDLVFFDANRTDQKPTTHVGIYYGDNKIIHMANEELDIVISDLSSSYYTKNYYTARRVIPTYLIPQTSAPKDSIVEFARSLIGVAKYGLTYNEQTLTFNSPEFAYYVYKKNGINLGTKYSYQQAKLGQAVSIEKLQPGDLLFFALVPGGSITSRSLVGIYSGSGEFIFCSSTGVVKKNLSNDYYKTRFVTARHIQ